MAEVADPGGRRGRRDASASDARSFASDIGSAEARNDRVTANQIEAGAGAADQMVTGSSVSEADIAGAVRSYRLQADSGLGLVFIMDRLVTSKERGFQDKGCLYVVFFDVGSRRVLSSERLCEKPGGTHPSHYWFNPIKEAVKKLPPLYSQVVSR